MKGDGGRKDGKLAVHCDSKRPHSPNSERKAVATLDMLADICTLNDVLDAVDVGGMLGVLGLADRIFVGKHSNETDEVTGQSARPSKGA